jgi:hypothetical protein
MSNCIRNDIGVAVYYLKFVMRNLQASKGGKSLYHFFPDIRTFHGPEWLAQQGFRADRAGDRIRL